MPKLAFHSVWMMMSGRSVPDDQDTSRLGSRGREQVFEEAEAQKNDESAQRPVQVEACVQTADPILVRIDR